MSLIPENPRLYSPSLAKVIGLNEAIFLEQIHYWITKNRKDGTNLRDGRHWTYNGYTEWQTENPWWSVATIRRIVGGLERRGLLESKQWSVATGDCRKWYTIDYAKVDTILISNDPSVQNEQTPPVMTKNPHLLNLTEGSDQPEQPRQINLSNSSYTETTPQTPQKAAEPNHKVENSIGDESVSGHGSAAAREKWLTPEAEQALLIMTTARATAEKPGADHISGEDALDILREVTKNVHNDWLIRVARQLAKKFIQSRITNSAGGWWRQAWRKWRQYFSDEAIRNVLGPNRPLIDTSQSRPNIIPTGPSDTTEDWGRETVQKLNDEELDHLMEWLSTYYVKQKNREVHDRIADPDSPPRSNRSVYVAVGTLLKRKPELLKRVITGEDEQ